MQRPVALAALLLVVASASRGLETPPALEARGGSPSFASPGRGPQELFGYNTRTLAAYDFDNGGNTADSQGWTTHDLTAQIGDFWHVDDFAGIGQPAFAPITGSKSLWCGVEGIVESYAVLPGYGNRWTQVFQTALNFLHLSPADDIVLTFKEKHQLNTGDKVEVQLFTESGRWHTLLTLSGNGGTTVTTRVVAAPADSIAPGGAPFRFLMTSDYRVSGEDGLGATLGVIIIDDISVTNGAFHLNTETFEGEAVGATQTLNGRWLGFGASGLVPFGQFAGLVDGDTVLQESTTPVNPTHVWSFFNGSTDTYACGGHPEQTAVPFGRVPSTILTDHLDNSIHSPWIPLASDSGGALVPAEYTRVGFEYDVYADNLFANHVGWRERFRFKSFGAPGPWIETAGVYYTGVTPPPRWFRLSLDAAIPAFATEVQFGIEVIDHIGGLCHSHAPLIDNVTVLRYIPPVVVTSTANSGPGTLRDAMTIAESNPDVTHIAFDLPSGGPYTISPLTPLPTLTRPVIIDGFTQGNAQRNSNPVGQPSNAIVIVELDGSLAGANAVGLDLRADATVTGISVINFSSYGMYLSGGTFTVEGCHIGVNAIGDAAGPNAFDGIYLDESFGSRIGGTAPGARNVIGGNGRNGIAVNKSGNGWIQGNYLGVAADGITPVPNDDSGVALLDDAVSHTIGEAPAGNCSPAPQGINLIAHNGGDGVEVSEIGAVDAEENSILSNIIHSNGGLGIDLGPNGITLNDFNDVDTGGNGRQNYPNISSAEDSTIKFSLLGKPSTNYVIQFFRNASCDASGNGEGQFFMSQMSVTSSVNGNVGAFMTCGPIPPGSILTATATDPNGNTSEFSPCVTSTNTTLGTDLWVAVPDEDGNIVANLFFEQVTSTGNTFVTPGAAPPEPVPGAFTLGDPPVYYDITTTAGYNTALGVDVCLRYDEATLSGDENDVVLLHYDTALADWVDVTTSRDTAGNFVCGHVNSFSPFVVATPNVLVGVGGPQAPAEFALRANVPNPFNPVTTIGYDVPAGGAHVAITVFDVAGRKVRTLLDRRREAGAWTVQWDGTDDRGRAVASGVYFYRMRAGGYAETRKMVLLK